MSSTIKVNNIQNLAGDDSGFDLSTNDKIGMKIANSEVITVDTTGVVLNEGSADRDFRVESNGNANMLVVDGGNDRVGIGEGTPDTLVHLTADGENSVIRMTRSDTASTGNNLGVIEFENSVGTVLTSIKGKSMSGNTEAGLTFSVGASNSEVMRIDNNGQVGIGTTSPDGLLTVSGQSNPLVRFTHTQNASETVMVMQHGGALGSGFETQIQFRDGGGTIRGTIKTNSGSTQYNTTSDYRLKENVTYDFDATSRLKQLKPARFNFIGNKDYTVDGFLAHEVSSIVPEAISGEKDAMTEEVLYVDGDEIPDGKKIGDVKEASEIDPQGIDQSKLVPLLTKALQEQQATIEALEARITALEGK
tara:strand:+ start:141 stop:1226 length:1086 start_codon:yes stop_codon:yes gene_type:complete